MEEDTYSHLLRHSLGFYRHDRPMTEDLIGIDVVGSDEYLGAEIHLNLVRPRSERTGKKKRK